MKLLAGMIIGSVLLGALFSGPLSTTPASGQELTSGEIAVTAETSGSESNLLLSSLYEAGKTITDEDLARYYHLLLEEYDLNEVTVDMLEDETSGLAELLPDIAHINKTAMWLPLREAGKNIEDEEIAAFYAGFLEKTGWTGDGETGD